MRLLLFLPYKPIFILHTHKRQETRNKKTPLPSFSPSLGPVLCVYKTKHNPTQNNTPSTVCVCVHQIKMELDYSHLLLVLLISYILLIFVVKAVVHLWWTPRRIEKHFSKQGIRGPKYQLLLGNLKELASLNLRASTQPMTLSHNILPRVLSFYHHWRKIYGIFLFFFSSPFSKVGV